MFVSLGRAVKPSCLLTACRLSLAPTTKRLCLKGSCRDRDDGRVLEKDEPLGSNFHRFVVLKNDYIAAWKLVNSHSTSKSTTFTHSTLLFASRIKDREHKNHRNSKMHNYVLHCLHFILFVAQNKFVRGLSPFRLA